MKTQRLVLIVHNVRSAHNVGSILRSADGFGVDKVFLTGYTPYPIANNDGRLPHIAKRTADQIHKTALGADKTVKWHHESDIAELIHHLKKDSFVIVALEQSTGSTPLQEYQSPNKLALVVGSELGGLEQDILEKTDAKLEIPMVGTKESFNVSVAAAVALYHLRYIAKKSCMA